MSTVYVFYAKPSYCSRRPSVGGHFIVHPRDKSACEHQLLLRMALHCYDFEEGKVIIELEGHRYFLEEFTFQRWEIGSIRTAFLEWHQGRVSDTAAEMEKALRWANKRGELRKSKTCN